jgi:hypothetical protein
MAQYRKRPIVVEAIQWTGKNFIDVLEFGHPVLGNGEDNTLLIYNPEGVITVFLDDWVIKGTKGEIYPCKPDIFVEIYEAVTDVV